MIVSVAGLLLSGLGALVVPTLVAGGLAAALVLGPF